MCCCRRIALRFRKEGHRLQHRFVHPLALARSPKAVEKGHHTKKEKKKQLIPDGGPHRGPDQKKKQKQNDTGLASGDPPHTRWRGGELSTFGGGGTSDGKNFLNFFCDELKGEKYLKYVEKGTRQLGANKKARYETRKKTKTPTGN